MSEALWKQPRGIFSWILSSVSTCRSLIRTLGVQTVLLLSSVCLSSVDGV